jgi:hypothetical protein
MATSQTCCHLPGEILNSDAECADRARIEKEQERDKEKERREKETGERKMDRRRR